MGYRIVCFVVAALLAGCASTEPAGSGFVSAETRLGEKRGDYSRLTVAFVVSEKTKSVLENPPNTAFGRADLFDFYQPKRWLTEIEAVFSSRFKSLAKAGSISDARAAGTDLIAEVDCIPIIGHGNQMDLEIRSVFTAPNGDVIDTVFAKNKNKGSVFVPHQAQNAQEAQRNFGDALLYSKKLVEFAENHRPGTPSAPVALSAPSRTESPSDVDSPGYKKPARPDDFALVIGIEKYNNLPSADFGVRDAQAVRRHLAALGVPERNIISLEGPNATRSRLQSYLTEWLPLNVKPGSTLFVYYSGHGAPDSKTGEAYLVPWDGDPQFLKSTAYPLKQLYADLGKLGVRHVVVALDACFSGAGGRSVLAQGARPLVTQVDAGFRGSDTITLLAAASGDEVTGTLSEQGHGMFTYYLLRGLGEAARDSSGGITAKGLFDYLKPNVQDEARRQNRQQTPTYAGSDFKF